MPETLVAVEHHDATALVTLDRPAALNALSRELVTQLADRLEEVAADPTVRAVVLTGSEKAFCAGADIAEIPHMTGASPTDRLPFDRLFDTVASLPRPTIAAVRGLAFGGGCELVLACDTAVAGRSARFAVPEVKLGVIPGAGGTQRLVHAIGKAKAMRMLLTGGPVDAQWAHEAGLVADVVDDDGVIGRALEIADHVGGNAPRAVILAADSARHAQELPLHQGLAHERRNFLLALGTSDAHEGVAAFTAHRHPTFTGR
ncbi:2,3-dehydroadipyl-CoA hydratase [Geodermatophilus sp. TF02-6]|uniref:enoyl-CoA hydratase/isomerase family protein n=1 Tax=Geodermatophilus sp. TF02-6 TaxID=2250575 RepID=UPI000DE8ED28|nr:enoyl-CoA hydratase-related protein [Geodermatophilus sp. TF02-6]RBY81785.1 2,3-dehydroadipyl-CoA hydratase [Geodermatophilus sp. TF02-6]